MASFDKNSGGEGSVDKQHLLSVFAEGSHQGLQIQCISYLLLRIILPQNKRLKTTQIYYAKVFVCQESGPSGLAYLEAGLRKNQFSRSFGLFETVLCNCGIECPRCWLEWGGPSQRLEAAPSSWSGWLSRQVISRH